MTIQPPQPASPLDMPKLSRKASPNCLLRFAAIALAAALTTAAWADKAKASKYYEDALARYERKDLAGAILQLKNATQEDKNLLPVQVLLGKVLLEDSQPAAAEVALSEALLLGVNRAEVVVPLAKSLIMQGRQAEVFEQARLDLAGLPPDVRRLLALQHAAARTDMGDAKRAQALIDEARSADPNAVDSWIAEVLVRIRANQLTEAMNAAERAVQLAPNSADALYQKASVQHLLLPPKAVLPSYDRVLAVQANHVEARIARAGLLVDLQRHKEAAADISEVLRLSPDEPRAVYLQAVLADAAGDKAASRANLAKVTGLIDPVPINFLRYRPQLLLLNGLAHFDMGEPLKARPYLEAFHRSQPQSPTAKLLAQIYLGDGAPERAIETLESYLIRQPADGQAMMLLASANIAQGRHSRATSLMQEALKTKERADFRSMLGMSYLKAGRYGDAREALEASLKKDPRQLGAGVTLVGLLMRDSQYAKAASRAAELVKANPNNPSLLTLQGEAQAAAGNVNGAKLSFEQALALDRTLAMPRVGLARISVQRGDMDAAAARLTEILKQDERNLEALLAMANLAERRQRPDEALRYAQKAVDAATATDIRPHAALVTLLLRLGKKGDALAAAKVMLAKAAENGAALVLYAQVQMANADKAGARATLTQAARRAPADASALSDIAGLQLLADDPAGAAYTADKALALAPDFVPALIMQASVSLRQADLAKAETRIKRIIQMQPKREVGYTLLADLAQARNQPTAVIEALQRAHEIEPSTATLLRLSRALSGQPGGLKQGLASIERWTKAHPKDLAAQRALAEQLVALGDLRAARAAYESLLAVSPQDAVALNDLANVLLQTKDPGALKIAEQAMSLQAGNPIVQDTYAWALAAAGQLERALPVLRDARLRAPENAEIRYHLGAVLAKTGKHNEAKQELNAAVQKNPGSPEAKAAQMLLDTLK